MKRFILLLTAGLTGCSTIHFTNGPQMEETIVREQLHHITLNDLVEISPPMNVTYNCASQEWDTVTIERTFINGFVGAFTQAFQGLSIYSPWTIRYHCRDPLVPFAFDDADQAPNDVNEPLSQPQAESETNNTP